MYPAAGTDSGGSEMDEAEFVFAIESLAWKGLVIVERDINTGELRLGLRPAGYAALREVEA